MPSSTLPPRARRFTRKIVGRERSIAGRGTRRRIHAGVLGVEERLSSGRSRGEARLGAEVLGRIAGVVDGRSGDGAAVETDAAVAIRLASVDCRTALIRRAGEDGSAARLLLARVAGRGVGHPCGRKGARCAAVSTAASPARIFGACRGRGYPSRLRSRGSMRRCRPRSRRSRGPEVRRSSMPRHRAKRMQQEAREPTEA